MAKTILKKNHLKKNNFKKLSNCYMSLILYVKPYSVSFSQMP